MEMAEPRPPTLRSTSPQVCAHRVLVGVHGQGMEWGHLLNGGDPRGAALIEFRAGNWPCYYAFRMKASGIHSDCQARRKPPG